MSAKRIRHVSPARGGAAALAAINTIADLELVLTDGSRVTTSYDSGVPASDIREQGRRLEEKFVSLAQPVLGAAKTLGLIAEIGRLETLPELRDMMNLCGT